MKGIRAFQREDAEQVANLYEYVMRSKKRQAPTGMAAYFERIFLDHPWYDPELPSLVYENDDGGIAGFAGSHVRRFQFEGEPIRVAVCGQLIADPDVRSQAVGAFLMRKFMVAGQDLSLMEMCSDGMRQIWENLGGKTVHLNSLNYTRFFRPTRFALNQVLARRPSDLLKKVASPISNGLDAIIPKAYKALQTETITTNSESVTPEGILEHLPTITKGRKLVPEYDLKFLNWQFFEMAQVASKGELLGNLVRDEKDKVVGWYLYQMIPFDKGHIIQVEAKRGSESFVLDHLFAEANKRGATLLHGRMEPNLHVPIVKKNQCWLHSRWDRTLIHSKRNDIVQAYFEGSAMATRMEGEFWMGFHLEPFNEIVENPFSTAVDNKASVLV